MKDTSRLLRGLWIPFILLPPLFAREFPHGRRDVAMRDIERLILRTTGEEVSFMSGGETLSGILRLPNTPGPHPAIVMLHGSGPTSIREWLTDAFPFWRDLAQFFLGRNYAVLAFDKAGVGRSTGNWRTRSFEDRADEAMAAVEYLRSRADIDGRELG